MKVGTAASVHLDGHLLRILLLELAVEIVNLAAQLGVLLEQLGICLCRTSAGVNMPIK